MHLHKLKFPLSYTYDFSSKLLHHFKNNAIRVSKIKSSTFPKSICSKVEILRFRQAFYMIFYKGSVNSINVIRVKAHFLILRSKNLNLVLLCGKLLNLINEIFYIPS